MAEVSAGRKSAGFAHGFGGGLSGRRSCRCSCLGGIEWGLGGGAGCSAGIAGGALSGAASAGVAADGWETSDCPSSRALPSGSGSALGSTFPGVWDWAASSVGRGPRPRPRPPRRPRRRGLGRRAEGGKFRLDCSSGTILFRRRMAACRANAKPNPLHFLTKRARAAVWLCRKFFCPMGPISPLQKNPARPSGPK